MNFMPDSLINRSRSLGRIFLRAVVAFGMWYFFWLVFYFDFLQNSFRMVSRVSDPGGLILIPLGIVLSVCLLALFFAIFSRRISDYSFVRSVVLSGAALNVSSCFAIGYESALTWVSTTLGVGVLIATWKTSSHQLIKSLYICGTLGAIYAAMDQSSWAWSQRHKFLTPPTASNSPADRALTDELSPSIYIIVMEEMSLSLVNTYANFLSLPNLSRLAREGVYFPRAYVVSDGTIWSMPSVFTARYPSEEMLLQHEFNLGWMSEGRNLLTDLVRRGYRLKIYNDLFGICSKLTCSHLEIDTRSADLLSSKQLTWFALDNLIHFLTFGWHRPVVISGLMQGQAERIFQLGHSRDWPQLVYIHLFDSHHNYKRNRDGSFHTSPYQTFRGVPSADADKVAENYFEQILWADTAAGPLVDALLSIPPEERIVVFLSDHGISWREPPFYRETGWLNSSQVNVPVVLIAPDLEPDIYSELFPLIDIYPTLVDLLSRSGDGILEKPQAIDGLSLFESESRRRDRSHYGFSVGCKYELREESWSFVKRYEAEGSGGKTWQCTDQPIPAKELARTASATYNILREARDPKPLPVVSSHRAELLPQPPMGPMEGEIVHMEEEGYRGYNILRYGGIYYGISQSDGEFIYQKFLSGGYKAGVTGKTATEVRQAIARLAVPSEMPLLVEEGYYGYNIILYKGRFYGIRQSDGEFDYLRFERRGFDQAYWDNTLLGVKKSIAKRHKLSSDEVPNRKEVNEKQ